jgi:glutaminyl-tRNA synthetase
VPSDTIFIGGDLRNPPKVEDRYQSERVGYFCFDPDSKPEKVVFNRTLALKDV